jgi:hypothetical protein
MDTIKCIRSMLRNTCRSVEKVPFDARDYQSVVKLWVQYKRGVALTKQPTIDNFFSFHLSHDPHVLVYSSRVLDDVLIMGKVNGKYVNIKAPRGDVLSDRLSFVAVYGPRI